VEKSSIEQAREKKNGGKRDYMRISTSALELGQPRPVSG